MKFWRKTPFARLIIPLITGILMSEFLTRLFAWSALILLCSLCAYFLSRSKFLSIENRPSTKGLSGLLVILLLGLLIGYLNNEANNRQYFAPTKAPLVLVKISNNPYQNANGLSAEAQIIAIGTSRQWTKKIGNLKLYFYKPMLSIQYGDLLVIKRSSIKPIQGPANPCEFDFKRYLHFNNIHHSAFLSPCEFYPTGLSQANCIFQHIYNLQQYLITTFKIYFPDIQQRGIVEALIMGYKKELDKDIADAFSKTGVIHVLAVSGLHVGFIYMVLSFMTSFLKTTQKGRKLRVFVILCGLFLYAFLTGFSASVCRAGLMFSMFILSDILKRETNMLNALFSSAFLLLLFQPFWLFNAGFQLSYLAVIGIVVINKWLSQSIKITDWLGKKIWELFCVSIAAQIITFPLCVYYFHQFPLTFILANLAVIPLITIILFLIATVPVFHLVNTQITEWISNLASVYLQFIKQLIFALKGLPNSTIENIYINLPQMLLIYAALLFLILWIQLKHVKMLMASLCLWVVLVFTQIQHDSFNEKKQGWMRFSLKNSTAIAFKNGKDLDVYLDSLSLHDEASFNFHIKPFFIAHCGGRLHIYPLNTLMKLDADYYHLYANNQHSSYLLPTSKASLINQLQDSSIAFCLRPVYVKSKYQNKPITLIAPQIKGEPVPPNWHSLKKDGYWSAFVPKNLKRKKQHLFLN